MALLAHGIALAEVGVVIHPGSSAHHGSYVLELTEDPSPISGIWLKIAAPDPFHIDLNAGGAANGDGAPSMVTNASNGLIAAAWSRNSANGFDVVVSRFAGSAWTVQQVIVGSTANELDPQLVLDPNGSIHLFYWVDGTTPQVFHSVAPPDLSSWSTPVLVSQPGEASCRPAGVFFNGVLRVAYEVHNLGNGTTPRQVVLARFDNGTFTPEIVAMTSNPGAVRPQVHSHSGHLWVDWIDSETTGGSGEIAWTRLDAAGQWEFIRYEPYASYLEREYGVRAGTRSRAIE
jgi:hypothetical protein